MKSKIERFRHGEATVVAGPFLLIHPLGKAQQANYMKKEEEEEEEEKKKEQNHHLLEEAVDQCDRPESVFDVVPYPAGQVLIPDEHGVVHHLPRLPIAQILLKATHNVVWVAEKEVPGEIHIAEELLVSAPSSKTRRGGDETGVNSHLIYVATQRANICEKYAATSQKN